MKQILYDDPNFLGNRLRALRLTFGFTQSSVAEVLGINRSTYSYYESGTTRPDPVVLGKLASYYQIPVDVFFEEQLPLNIKLNDSQRRRTSRTSLFDPQRIGELLPSERALMLFVRANGKLSCEEILDHLKTYVEELKAEDTKESSEKPAE